MSDSIYKPTRSERKGVVLQGSRIYKAKVATLVLGGEGTSVSSDFAVAGETKINFKVHT